MSEGDNEVTMYTDGACRGNPGPGGWGAVLEYPTYRLELSGAAATTTNNQMELMAAIAGLESLKKSTKVILYTDSTYVKQGITTWIHNWKTRGWKTAARKPVKNEELWKRLDSISAEHTIDWRWVKGHAGNPGNERADSLATRAIDGDIVSERTELSA